MKVIFLDFDGVITTAESKWNPCLEKMQLVKRIVDATGAKVVISSSWRRHTLEQTIESITSIGNPFVKDTSFLMPEDVVGITARMCEFKHGKSETNYGICRGIEVQQYLDEHSDVERYVILDDDSDMLLSQKDKFIQTHACDGISEEDVKKAINVLN